MRLPGRGQALLWAVALLCLAARTTHARPTLRRALNRRRLEESTAAANACLARGINGSLWHAASGAEAAAALRSATGGSPDTKIAIQALNFGLDSATGAGVPLEAQSWPEGYEGKPFVAAFSTFLRAPYDGTYRFYLSADDATVFTLSEPDGTPIAVELVATAPEEDMPVNTTLYQADVPIGHYILSLQYAKTDASTQPRLKLEWEYPERVSPGASPQSGRIIPRSMLYKRDTFLNECSLPPNKAQLQTGAAVGGPDSAPNETEAPMTAPAGTMAPDSAPADADDVLRAEHAAVAKPAATSTLTAGLTVAAPLEPIMAAAPADPTAGLAASMPIQDLAAAPAASQPIFPRRQPALDMPLADAPSELIAEPAVPADAQILPAVQRMAPSVAPALRATAALPALPAEIAPAASGVLAAAPAFDTAVVMVDPYVAAPWVSEEAWGLPAGGPSDELYDDAGAPEWADSAWEGYASDLEAGMPSEAGLEDLEGYVSPNGAGWATFPAAVVASQAPAYWPALEAASEALPAALELAPAGAVDFIAAGPETGAGDAIAPLMDGLWVASPSVEELISATADQELPTAAPLPVATPALALPLPVTELLAAAPLAGTPAAPSVAPLPLAVPALDSPTAAPVEIVAVASLPLAAAPEPVAVPVLVDPVALAAGPTAPVIEAAAVLPLPLAAGPEAVAQVPAAISAMAAPVLNSFAAVPHALAPAPMPQALATDIVTPELALVPVPQALAPVDALAPATVPQVLVPVTVPQALAPVSVPQALAPATVPHALAPAHAKSPAKAPAKAPAVAPARKAPAKPVKTAAPVLAVASGPSGIASAEGDLTGQTFADRTGRPSRVDDSEAARITDAAADLFALPGSLPDFPLPRRPSGMSLRGQGHSSSSAASSQAEASVEDPTDEPLVITPKKSKTSSKAADGDTLSVSMPRLPDPVGDLFGA